MRGLVSVETMVLCQWGINSKIWFQNPYQSLYPQHVECSKIVKPLSLRPRGFKCFLLFENLMKSLHLFFKWYFKQDSVYTVLGLCTNIPIYFWIFRKYCAKLIEAILSKFALCSHKKLLAQFLARDFPHWTFV